MTENAGYFTTMRAVAVFIAWLLLGSQAVPGGLDASSLGNALGSSWRLHNATDNSIIFICEESDCKVESVFVLHISELDHETMEGFFNHANDELTSFTEGFAPSFGRQCFFLSQNVRSTSSARMHMEADGACGNKKALALSVHLNREQRNATVFVVFTADVHVASVVRQQVNTWFDNAIDSALRALGRSEPSLKGREDHHEGARYRHP